MTKAERQEIEREFKRWFQSTIGCEPTFARMDGSMRAKAVEAIAREAFVGGAIFGAKKMAEWVKAQAKEET